MVYMLKKSGVVIILTLLLVAFTVGSVSPVNTQYETRGDTAIMGHMIVAKQDGLPLPYIPVFGTSALSYLAMPSGDNGTPDLASATYPGPLTSVVLDLSGLNGPDPDGLWFATNGPGAQNLPMGPAFGDKREFIAARMIVHIAGNDTPQEFPVQFFRHGPDDIKNRTMFENFIANMDFRMSHDANGNPTGLTMYTDNGSDAANGSDSIVTFNGQITVAQPITNDSTQADAIYNDTITSGETVYHDATVNGSSTSLNVDLKWENPNDSMRLTIYTPDGHVLGPYYDSSDGKTDNAINLEIDNPSGVASGTWIFKVVDTGTTGKDEYYIKTW
jgi:hypothetical protein